MKTMYHFKNNNIGIVIVFGIAYYGYIWPRISLVGGMVWLVHQNKLATSI